jgi:hypothetical protein
MITIVPLHTFGRAVALTAIVIISLAAVAGCSSSSLPAGESQCSSVAKCVTDAMKRAQTGPLLFPYSPADEVQDGYYSSPAAINPGGAIQIDYIDRASGLPFFWKVHVGVQSSPSSSVCTHDGSNMTNVVTADGVPMCFMTSTGQQFFYSVGKTLYVLQSPSSRWPVEAGYGSPGWALTVFASLRTSGQDS